MGAQAIDHIFFRAAREFALRANWTKDRGIKRTLIALGVSLSRGQWARLSPVMRANWRECVKDACVPTSIIVILDTSDPALGT
jgi:hypothetical protein